MCLHFWWFLGPLDFVIVLLLSQNSTKGDTTKALPQVPTGTFEAKQLYLLL